MSSGLPFDITDLFGGGGFDTGSVEPMKDFSVVPPGKYVVQITEPEITPTKAGTGHFIRLILIILEGEHKNRKVWDRINIDNPSAKCKEMGLAVVAAIGRALQIQRFTSVTQLANGVLVAHVKVKNEQNEVRTYSSLESYRAEQAKQQQAVQPAQPVVAQAVQPVQQPQQAPPVQQQPPQQQAYAPQPGGVLPPATQPWARPQ